MKSLFLSLFLLMMLMANLLHAIESAVILKVNGSYGIINQGVNQGIAEGQIFFVKRETPTGLKDVAQVKVIRATANRAAVEQISPISKGNLEKGDKLFADQNAKPPAPKLQTNTTRPQSPAASGSQPATPVKKNSIEPITEPAHKSPDVSSLTPPANSNHQSYDFRKPWIGIQVGAIFPTGELSNIYSPSMNIGASYLVAAANDFNLGVEISKSFLGGEVSGAALEGGSVSSSSILQAMVVFQKYFGDYFFVEGGGGIFRPKIQTVSIDNVKSSFSSSNFGVFGGAGFLVPTSPYAGFTLRGRVHNYFDQTSRQYFGLAGGFRFKIH